MGSFTQLEYVPTNENDFAGLTLYQNEKFQFLFGKTIVEGKTVLNIYRIAKDKAVIASVVLEGKEATSPIKLKVEGKGGICNFLYSFDGKDWKMLTENADATNLSTQMAGGFIGTCIGMYATSNHQK